MSKTMIQSRRKRRAQSPFRFETDSDDPSLPFVFDLPPTSRILVDSWDKLNLFEVAVAKAMIIGIDTETKPNRRSNESRNKTALMQLCTRCKGGHEVVFIVDLIAISRHMKLMSLLDAVLIRVFLDRSVPIIGHGIQNDIKELSMSYPELESFKAVNNMLDTNYIHRKLNPDEEKDISLKKLTKTYLHLNLIKLETCSNWEQRPLSESQLHYCACDALVLLRLYDVMFYEAIDACGMNFTFDDISFNYRSKDAVFAAPATEDYDDSSAHTSSCSLSDISSVASSIVEEMSEFINSSTISYKKHRSSV
jgi:hypothetical protein